MSRKCDLLFMAILYVLVHVGLLLILGYIFLNLLWQYQIYDDSIRALLYDDGQPSKCTNVSLVIDHLLTQKNETAKSLLMHITYLAAIFVAVVIMLSRNFKLILAYTLFFVLILGGNLAFPMLTPYLSMTLFFTSTAFGITYIVVYLAIPEVSRIRATKTKTIRKRESAHAPRVPPFSDL